MKKSLLIVVLGILILTSTTATANNNEKSVVPIGSINFTDRVVYVLDHTNNPTQGNWIIMGNPFAETRIQLPHPIKITYKGPKHIEFGGASGTLYKDKNGKLTVNYPSAYVYRTLPIYQPGEDAVMFFFGEAGLKGDVEIFLIKVTPDTVFEKSILLYQCW